MLIEFQVIRVDDKIMGVSSNAPNLPNLKPELPLVAKRVQIAKYTLPQDVARSFYENLKQQMKGGTQ